MHTNRPIDDRASKHRRRRENPWVSITISRVSKGHPVDPQVHPRWSAGGNPIGRRCQNPIAFAYNRPLSGCRPSNLHGASLLSSQWRVDDRDDGTIFLSLVVEKARSWKTTPTLYRRVAHLTSSFSSALFFKRSVYSITIGDPRPIQGMTSKASVSSILEANHMARWR